jgi:LmbE family N-acetylglucosaminyl deacetylase
MNIVVFGAHPDDPESGCGGTMAVHSQRGDAVTALYATSGERGINGMGAERAAQVREAESLEACAILGAATRFLRYPEHGIDTSAEATDRFVQELRVLAPDLLIAHWPIDTHPDHQLTGVLALRAWLREPGAFKLLFFEVLTGSQTLHFVPDTYVDMSSAQEMKKEAIMRHASQQPEKWYPHHRAMEQFRGREARCEAAEAFVSARFLTGAALLEGSR